ncbi:WD40 repeat domain-containing protein [Streptomyces catenulae]|uniref:WD40 repeat domain-containing protein n=3 Tax=Streptomyces catenulae TaxID=66875 RepID=A0ABV2Z206_9ACTN|nr:WD40 repeat domain-containing protein [Streptomyces catenulae]
MTPHQEPAAGKHLIEQIAWATERGSVYQSAENMIVVNGGALHRHEHYHAGGEEYGRTTSPSADGECPYPGLRPFRRDESEWFFGREALVSKVMDRLEECLDDGTPLAVVAPSGAGKSSLLRAGLLPALTNGHLPGSRSWPQLLLTPTADPPAALTAGLAALTGAGEKLVREAAETGPGALNALLRDRLGLPPDGRVVLVVDQLEELFALSPEESARRRFVDLLDGLTGGEEPVALAVYGLRADFYGACAAFPHLRDALAGRQVFVGPMTDDEVRNAVLRPAQRAGLSLATGLVEVILRDLRSDAGQEQGTYEPGRLPLLAHALRATWRERRGDTLTVDSYRDTGGIDGAVKATAEEEFEKLSPRAQRAARRLFLSLARVSENGEVTRRRRTRRDLLLAAADPEAVPEVAERFTRARLLTQGVEREEGTVEITHEALLRAWPRLWNSLTGAGRPDGAVRQELEEAAVTWERDGRRDTAALYRGARLAVARTWASDAAPEDLTPLIGDFLDASGRQQRRTQLLGRSAVVAVTVLALLASGLAVFALDQSRSALEQRDNAIFERITAEADRQRESDTALAAQLDLVAYRMRPTAALHTRLMTEAGSVLSTTLPRKFRTVHSVAFGPHGELATGTANLQFWGGATRGRPTPLTGPLSAGKNVDVQPIAYNTRGDLLARGGSDGTVRILDVSDARHPAALSAPVPVAQGAVSSLKFSPDGRTLAVSAFGRLNPGPSTVQLWDVSDPRHLRHLTDVLSVREQGVSSVAFSPDGRTLAAAGGTVGSTGSASLLRLWNVSDPAHPTALGGPLNGHTAIVNQVVFSPSGRVMATAGSDNKVLVWDVSDPHRPKAVRQMNFDDPANSVAFSPDGHVLATGDQSGKITLWNVGSPGLTRAIGPPMRGHTTFVTGLAFDATGSTLASGGADGAVRLWRLPPTLAVTGDGPAAETLALSGDGRLLAVSSGREVTVWDVSDPTRLTRLGALPRAATAVNALAFRPGTGDRTVLATGEFGGRVQLWDVSAPARPVRIGAALPGQVKPVGAVAFASDGHTLLAASMKLQGSYVGGVRAWNVSPPEHPVPLGDGELPVQRLPLRGMAAAPSGEYVYTGDYFGNILVWHTGGGAAPSPSGQVASRQQIFALAVSARSPLLATGNSDSTVRLWDVSGHRSPTTVGQPLSAGGMVTSVGFSPSGHLLASGTAHGQIRLWDTSDPAHATAYGKPVTGHSGWVNGLLFGPRAGLLITSGQDGTVRLWQTDPARARTILCASTPRAMTPARWKKYVSPALPYDPPCTG